MTVRVGVIGVGEMGSIHAEHLASRVPGARLEAIAETNSKRARAAGRRFGVSKVWTEDAPLFRDTEIDAVVIATLRGLHPRLIIEAARAGKHIFCEKPLGSTLRECDAALDAVAKAEVKLQIGFHRRFDAHFAQVWETIRRGSIGEPRMMHMISRDPNPVAGNAGRSPEDLFLETTIHDLDMARHLSGSEIAEVFAVGVEAGQGLEGAIVTLRMANGVVATIDNHLRSAYGYDQRVEVFGSGGAVSIQNQTPDNTTLSDKRGVHAALPLHFFAERYDEAYLAELVAFVRCVNEGTEPPVTGDDGRRAVVAALAAVKSLDSGKPVAVR
jgi:myo-inositol 2-dehydrogenase/D-chiro-inositol 1-dehydrogenase